MTTNEKHMADLTGIDVPTMHDIIDDRMAADRDWNPVPAEYRDLSWDEVRDQISEEWAEDAYAREAQNAIPYRWQ